MSNISKESSNNPKNKKVLIVGFSLAIMLQLSILLVEYIGSALPIWTGNPITLKTEPIDPRSLFRGNYVALKYQINQIPAIKGARKNKVIYVVLKYDKNGVYHYKSAQFERPVKVPFIRGRITHDYIPSVAGKSVMHVNYGIEAFFMPKEKALETERKSRGVSEVIIYVSSNGKARAHSFVCLGDDCDLDKKDK